MPKVLVEVAQLEAPTRFEFTFEFDRLALNADVAKSWTEAVRVRAYAPRGPLAGETCVFGFTPSRLADRPIVCKLNWTKLASSCLA